MLRPIDRKALSTQVFEQLRDEIIGERYRPGEQLPPERELCEILKVNRSSVREALKRLEQARLIEIRQGGGSIVLDFRTNAGFDLLGDFIMLGGQLNYIALRSIFEFRSLICPEIARLAALRIQEPELSELSEIVGRIDSCPDDDGKKLQELDFIFFGLLVQACENIALQLIVNSTKGIYFAYQDFFTDMYRQTMHNRRLYRRIYDSVRVKDSERCAKLMRKLVDSHGMVFMERFSNQ